MKNNRQFLFFTIRPTSKCTAIEKRDVQNICIIYILVFQWISEKTIYNWTWSAIWFQDYWIMANVITWRRRMDDSLYHPTGKPCSHILGSVLCYVISGMMLLVVGVIITSLTFQNLENLSKERYAGPILITAGILLIAKGAFTRYRPQRSELARRRSFLRRYIQELYGRPIIGVREIQGKQLLDLENGLIYTNNDFWQSKLE